MCFSLWQRPTWAGHLVIVNQESQQFWLCSFVSQQSLNAYLVRRRKISSVGSMVGGRLSTTVRLTRTIARVGARAECAFSSRVWLTQWVPNFWETWPQHPPRNFCATVEATGRLLTTICPSMRSLTDRCASSCENPLDVRHILGRFLFARQTFGTVLQLRQRWPSRIAHEFACDRNAKQRFVRLHCDKRDFDHGWAVVPGSRPLWHRSVSCRLVG